ncbi:hypothetical protein [Parendozoicomonas haliclonae]|uniref:Uncharacterized protein n=1 Tax=Parendozoicomonas haliclonae TaxID=1960125 RepID=A0A1X7AEX4_9GAMM|nr:hypothetical protein [Parendozoicomonas haliclonae]SMA33442.1 hypothetical protein EHSB41UT_00282 [Parendozoicomonas haliclonae]
MSAFANNFDMSSTGINVEMSCFWCTDTAQVWFNESLTRSERYKAKGFRDKTVLIYTGQFDYNPHDFRKTFDYPGAKQVFKDLLDHHCGEDRDLTTAKAMLRELILGEPLRTISQEDMLDAVETHFYDHDTYCEFMEDNYLPLWHTHHSTGYSQGDHAEVIIPPEVLVEIQGENGLGIKATGDHIDKLIWNAPLYCRVTVDEDELDVASEIEDVYDYDPDTLIDTLSDLMDGAGDKYTDEKKDYTLKWVRSELPDAYPEYV